ncbi:tyrosinase family protein [Salininema proteolyticum]|uniref:Tyrosinase family protein n=1 Tax=Salininema proteolyticum TaxID=1607685 RepID=A0ABV8U584_9ACTN
MRLRKNVRNLTALERKRFVKAVLELKRRGEYDEYVRLHNEYFIADGEGERRVAHMAPSFTPWHRQFLLDFENALRSVDESVTVPYWDFTRDRAGTRAPWTKDFLGGDGRAEDWQVVDGPFAHRHGNWPIRVKATDEDFLMRRMGRPDDPVELPTRAETARALMAVPFEVWPYDSTAKRGFRNALEGWDGGGEEGGFQMHNRAHVWIGGQMSGGTSPNDPAFWLLHAFVDKLWADWRHLNPEEDYVPRDPIPDWDPQHGKVISLCEKLPPWEVTPADLLDHTRFGRYEHEQSEGGPGVPVPGFAGKAYRLDFGDGMVFENEYSPDGFTLYWRAVAGPAAGDCGTEELHVDDLARGRYFVSWTESGGVTVSHVMDLAAGEVRAFLTFPGEEPADREGRLARATLTEAA